MTQRPPHPDREGTGRGMEPFVLLALATGPTYGYDLAQMLSTLGFRRAAQDPSVVYKLLRALEQRGLLRSTWQASADGPSRRSYQLTETGEVYLHERAADMERQVQRLLSFLTRYAQRFPQRQPSQDHQKSITPHPSLPPVENEKGQTEP
jgi:PadR family transcriptional regulator, regulatory protein PadR